MNKLRGCWLIPVLVLAFVAAWSPARDGSAQDPPTTTFITNDRWIRLEYPAEWSIWESDDPEVSIFMLANTPAALDALQEYWLWAAQLDPGEVGIVCLRSPYLEQLVGISRQDSPTDVLTIFYSPPGPDAPDLAITETRVGDYAAARFDAVFWDNAALLLALDLGWGERLLLVALTGAEDFSAHEATVMAIAESLVYGGDATVLLPSTGEIQTIAWSPDGSRVITRADRITSEERTTHLWDPATGTALFQTPGGQAAWSPNGSQLITWGTHYPGRLWDAATGDLVAEFHAEDVRGMGWKPDGTQVVTAYPLDDRTGQVVQVWDAMHGAEVFRFPIALKGTSIIWVGWSPDGGLIWADVRAGAGCTPACTNGIWLWDAETGDALPPLVYEQKTVGRPRWNADGTRLYTYHLDKSGIILWNTLTGEELLRLPNRLLSWSPDGTKLLAWDKDTPVTVWDAITGTAIVALPAVRVAWHPDGATFITWGEEQPITLHDAATGAALWTLSGDANATELAWDGTGSRFLHYQMENRVVSVRATQEGDSLLTLEHTAGVLGAEWNGNASHIVTWADDNTARVWHAGTGNLVATLTLTDTPRFATWDGTDRWLVTATEDDDFRIWEATTGTELLALGRGRFIHRYWSPDGDTLVTFSYDDSVARLWDLDP